MSSTHRTYIDKNGKTGAELYFEGCLDGTYVVGRYMRMLAEKMLHEIRDGYKRWHYDPEYAVRPVRFIERFCRHTSGSKGGKPFIMEPYEMAIVETAFGFVDDEGYRRFREVLTEVSRKCGKTELLAALNIYMLTSDGEYGAQCYNGATTKSQAALCYGKTKKMVEKSPLLAKRVRSGHIDERDTTGLIYDKTSSYLCTISSRADALDGLDMHFGVLDELAATRDNGSVYGLLKGSMGSRKQPMLFMISSNGHVRDNIFDDRRDYAIRWLKDDIEDDRFLAFLYEMDSREEVNQRDMWPKASPGLGTVKSWDYMDDMVQQMRQNPRDAGEILAKQFNLPENEASSFLTYNECHNDATFEFNPKTDRYGVVGFDLAKSGDLNAAVCMYMRPGDEHIYELTMSWIAEEQVKINSNMLKERDSVPYHLWASKDYIRIVEGDKVNQRVVIDWIQELARMGIMIRYVGYDSWHVDDWTQRELAMMVGEENFEPIPQYAKTLSPAMVEHQIDLRAKRIVSNNNPIVEWCRSNVQTKARDANDNYFPQKKGLRANRRIDMYMAELFAYIELKKHWDEYLQMIGWDRA